MDPEQNVSNQPKTREQEIRQRREKNNEWSRRYAEKSYKYYTLNMINFMNVKVTYVERKIKVD